VSAHVGGIETLEDSQYRGTSLIRNSASLGPYSRAVLRALWWSSGGGLFRMSELPLYPLAEGSLEAGGKGGSGGDRDNKCPECKHPFPTKEGKGGRLHEQVPLVLVSESIREDAPFCHYQTMISI